MDLFERFLGFLARRTERIRVWHHWPFLLGLAIVVGHRVNLRHENLTDTETAPKPVPPPEDFDIQGARTADGTFNDLGTPWMGSAHTRFGRNLPLSATYAETGETLMDPSPRLVSRRLLARGEFAPVPHLNLLAAAWIQFMVHDWLGHGKNDKTVKHEIPLEEHDDFPMRPMTVLRTRPDPDTNPQDEGRPSTFRNVETHWWDGSQIYGSGAERLRQVRGGVDANGQPSDVLPDGKLAIDDKGHLLVDPTTKEPNLELSGVNGNWWVGLSVLHTLFTREHNAIVDRLRIDHPQASGEWLFQKARLVNAALMAKIHTVEWTPALMDSPVGRMAMRGNFWGLTGEHIVNAFGRPSDSEVIAGIPGSPQDHHGVPYAMTEEFTAVYRLHSLLPDGVKVRRHTDDSAIVEKSLLDLAFGKTREIYDSASFPDVLYSLATSHPGALVLNNFPNSLRRLEKKADESIVVDLAAVDILRDRERGVPRFKEFRRLIGMKPPETFADITDDADWQKALKEVYGTVDKVDLLVGTLAEARSARGTPYRFGFSDTAFRVFIVMASRRLKSDRFYTDDFRPEIYTEAGFRWVRDNTLSTVIRRHCPELADRFADARNPFFPWAKAQR
ncbi:peroxidase family protein [uncultured Rhodospira sp.]|uniref:peroxidase family protein n=1 Tax=uncultured Rhodospira sp. TaxID=1936189 RepID=UPI00260605D0|nr:peroxidase family protein [uncultured Rhodospira sp.]